jgi:hypothetical protein
LSHWGMSFAMVSAVGNPDGITKITLYKRSVNDSLNCVA